MAKNVSPAADEAPTKPSDAVLASPMDSMPSPKNTGRKKPRPPLPCPTSAPSAWRSISPRE
ncbi:hypothetical protein N9194_01565, partial [bacterium]|nr:hypothetical protein [bacterium]